MNLVFCLLDYVQADDPCFTYTISSVCFGGFAPFSPYFASIVYAAGMLQLTACEACRYVYDGEFEGQMSMLHDTNKRLIKVSDIYPDYVDLKKGDYVIRLQLRHDDAVLLDKMKETPVVVERKLKEAVTVPVYATNRDAVKGGKAVKERALHPGGYDTMTNRLKMQAQLC